MNITVFSREATSKEGRKFHTYFGRLTKTDGDEVSVNLKFRKACGEPDGNKCPMNIIVDKAHANYTEKEEEYTTAEGEQKTALKRTLWINEWTEGEPYMDKSLDAFVD